ncbi:hypothetical protein P0M11_04835 [Kaistella sp. PBT33-4]|uniref:hypothetical protein n=1 Tax=Kaistella sp. PBT33-4 TaxID=3032000 RepID=UPI0023D8680D|nr:hypothetical protein [Kaistella sp. PBT33-4]MDF0719321.1 hypothetical protein [Kaistella sp. PBT33-4]
MKNLTLVGIILLALAFLLYYMLPEFSMVKLFEPISLMGILAGIGIGLIIGGIVGYVSKGSALKEEQKRREYKQLLKEKAELEKLAAEKSVNQSTTVSTPLPSDKKNTQNWY